jgi:hypothetical protein
VFIPFHVLEEQTGAFPQPGTRVAVLDVIGRIEWLKDGTTTRDLGGLTSVGVCSTAESCRPGLSRIGVEGDVQLTAAP